MFFKEAFALFVAEHLLGPLSCTGLSRKGYIVVKTKVKIHNPDRGKCEDFIERYDTGYTGTGKERPEHFRYTGGESILNALYSQPSVEDNEVVEECLP